MEDELGSQRVNLKSAMGQIQAIKYAKQADFPYIKEFSKKFVVSENTVFAYDNTIFSDKEVPPDILIHEQEHLRQQNQLGAFKWIEKYLEDADFRLNQELKAFRKQLEFFKDREAKNFCRMESSRNLADNYDLKITYKEAFKRLM